MTSGDEAGSAHPTVKGGASYTMGNPIVNIDKAPAITLTSTGMANNGNCPMNAAIVPSAVTVMFCRAGSATESAEPNDGREIGDARVAHAAPIEMLGDERTRRSIASARMLGGGVLLVQLERMAPGATAELFSLLEATRDVRALVLDLRGNPGGALEVALQLSRFFLPAGAVVAHLIEGGDESAVLIDQDGGCALPLVVLVDGGTASAAELLAAALQDNHRGLVVGSRSYGKRVVHRVASAPGGATTLAAELSWDRPSRGARRIVPDVPAADASALE